MAVSKFYKTIKEVNIGAFPLRPKDVENRNFWRISLMNLYIPNHTRPLLMSYRKGCVCRGGQSCTYWIGERRQQAVSSVYGRNCNLVLFRKTVPNDHRPARSSLLHAIHQRKGIRDVYEIVKVRTITGKEAKQTDEDDADSKALRLALNCGMSASNTQNSNR